MSNTIKLTQIVKSIIEEQKSISNLLQKYVGEGKPISNEDYKKIREKLKIPQHISWFIMRIINDVLVMEDIDKFEKYLNIFTKNKENFEKNDILQYKTKDEVNSFISDCEKIMNNKKEFPELEETKNDYVSRSDIKKLEEVGIKYYGISEGYQIFEAPNKLKNDVEAYKRFRNILGKCSARNNDNEEDPEKISICVIADFKHWKSVFNDNPGTSYFCLYKYSDPMSPYVFVFESGDYRNRMDLQIF